MNEDGKYHVAIEARQSGGFIVSLTGPNIPLSDVEITDTLEEAREWAAKRVEWRKAAPSPVEYEL